MTRSPWQLAGTIGRFEFLGAPATIDLAQPRLGLQLQNAASSLLGLQLGTSLVDFATVEPTETYVRGDDLVATYNQTEARPLRVQGYWHVAELAHLLAGNDGRMIELQVSINTTLLDLRPTIDVVTSTVAPVEKLPFGEASAWLFRLAASPYTYVEIPHPHDCARTLFEQAGDGRTTLRHTLFGRKLEKGVIMRGRIRGAFVPRATDVDAAALLVDDLLNAAPPLTT